MKENSSADKKYFKTFGSATLNPAPDESLLIYTPGRRRFKPDLRFHCPGQFKNSPLLIFYRPANPGIEIIRILHNAHAAALHILDKQIRTLKHSVLRRECREILLRFFEKELGRKSLRWFDIELPKK